MAVYTILPGENITENDIRDTLNANGGNVTNEAISWFQSKANIRIWARNKPIRSNKLFGLTDQEKRNALFGLSIPKAGTYGGGKLYFLHELVLGVLYSLPGQHVDNYTYLLPRGADFNELYRLDDFLNYNSKAQPINETSDFNNPMDSITHNPTKVNYSITTKIQTGITPNISPYDIHISDIIETFGGDLDKYYLCCEVMNGNFAFNRDDYLKTIRSDVPLTTDGYDGYRISFDLDQSNINKTYTLIFGIKYYDVSTNSYDESRNLLLYSNFAPCKTYSVENYFPWSTSTTHFCVDYVTKRWYDVSTSGTITSYTATIFLKLRIKQIEEKELTIQDRDFKAFNTYGNKESYGLTINSDLTHTAQYIIPRGSGYSEIYLRFDDIASSGNYQSLILYFNIGNQWTIAASASLSIKYNI